MQFHCFCAVNIVIRGHGTRRHLFWHRMHRIEDNSISPVQLQHALVLIDSVVCVYSTWQQLSTPSYKHTQLHTHSPVITPIHRCRCGRDCERWLWHLCILCLHKRLCMKHPVWKTAASETVDLEIAGTPSERSCTIWEEDKQQQKKEEEEEVVCTRETIPWTV